MTASSSSSATTQNLTRSSRRQRAIHPAAVGPPYGPPPLVFNSNITRAAAARKAAGYIHPHLRPRKSLLRPSVHAGFHHPSFAPHANMPKFSRPPPSVSPLPFTQTQNNITTIACLGIAYGNSGSILSYASSAFRDSASTVESMS